ncbi:uncharacterized protein LOC114303175 [Camellia sinensis]|uniref:uncharacterized protein LOC114303175 n=1 Tax=Camellia sinensis TaxID=4442 RepID=UPI00103558B4|nr:uncharacterized protein LOC114303175 [Camellia sinensis]
MATRGKFARVCVEMDLNKPLKPKFMLEGMVYNIEYESLHSFCFLYGKIDHRKEACRFKTPSAAPVGENIAISIIEKSEPQSVIGNGHLYQQREEDEAFGPWMLVLVTVYASLNPTMRETLWDELEEVAKTMSRPWLVVGDFNDYASQGERRCFSPNTTTARTQKFLKRINNCNLIDLGSSGPKMTWTNNRQGLANTVERLNRALSNPEWRTMFPEATVRVLPRTYSDHSPLLVYTQGMHSLNPSQRPFRFEAAWMSHSGLIHIINSSWCDMHNNLLDSTAEFTRKEETLWFQKSRAKHITLGDRNTKFFHISTITKRRKTKINALKDTAGTWLTKANEINAAILDYFQNLFNCEDVIQLDHWNNLASTYFTHDDNFRFLKPISNAEILRAVKAIGAFKAPGKDGMQAIFYKTYWNYIDKSVCEFVKSCFHNKTVPPEVNETLIVLVPKVDSPETITQFRPIRLCDVTYKIITKIIVGRIRPLLDTIVSPNQSSFIPGKNTTDNIIITQEILHTLRHKKGKSGGMIFKIDLEKAYDRLSWTFIKDTLLDFKLNGTWVYLIMSCVTNKHSSILWNGEITDEIHNRRGLRQGDPLSPYLFVLCMERLSNMIHCKVHEGSWKGIKASKNSPSLSHLFFADDFILFAQANSPNCETIMDTLSELCDVSTQKVNLLKSKLFVSPNVPRNLVRALTFQSGIPLTHNLGKYPGSPLLHQRVTRNLFTKILGKMKADSQVGKLEPLA